MIKINFREQFILPIRERKLEDICCGSTGPKRRGPPSLLGSGPFVKGNERGRELSGPGLVGRRAWPI